MKRQRRKLEAEGTITVFLSLILLLILSLLFTIIEGARISTAKVFAERSLTSAMDSVLAEYYGPLWKEYHVFGLDAGYGSKTVQEDIVEDRLKDYMSYTFLPNRDINQVIDKECLELYDVSVEELSVTDKTKLIDYQGNLMINQAVEYMKYKEQGNGIELLLEKMSLLESPRKVSILYEEKQKVEEELVEIDEGVLELMELLDGIKTGKRGIEGKKDGSLKTVSYFVKKICIGPVTKEEVGINQESIFLTQKGNYINHTITFGEIEVNFAQLEGFLQVIEDTKKVYEETVTKLSKENEALEELNKSDIKPKEVKAQIKEAKEIVKKLEVQKEGLSKKRKEYESKKNNLIMQIRSKKQELTQLVTGITPLIDNAIASVDNILSKAEKAEPLLAEYEKHLYMGKEEVGEDIFGGLVEELNELKRYTTKGEQGYDFNRMKQILEYDSSVLLQVEGRIQQGEQELLQEHFENARKTFHEAGMEFETYQIDGLTIDYSSLVLKKDERLNPIGMMESLLQEGITGLVMDPETISSAVLTEELLPSVISSMGKSGGFLFNISSFFQDTVIGSKSSGLGSLFASFSEGSGALSMMGETANSAAEHFLFQEYLREHFYSFPKEGEEIKTRKPQVLTYEQEYLLVGETSDKENLSSVISRILFVRTILDFVSILGDRAKCEEAQLVAASLVGFTGLPILVSMTKTLILLIWSFAEALMDTCTLMMGKVVPIIKKNIVLSFPELFTINGSFLQKKASETLKTKELSFSYHDYLRIFLFIKNKKDLAYRSMDLIQENIRIRYEDSFHIQNCLFGLKAEVNFHIASKFAGVSFLHKYLGGSVEGFPFKTEAEYSY